MTLLIPGATAMPYPWGVLSRPHARRASSKGNLSSKQKVKKLNWLTDGLYYWTEDWPHICSVAPISGAGFDEDAVGKYSGKTEYIGIIA